MAKVNASAAREIDAPASDIYGIIADETQRQQFLPDAYSDFTIEEGGNGAGTVTRFKLATRPGKFRECTMEVTEPDPGKTLVETDRGSSLVTTFTVTPEGDSKSRVSIATSWNGAGGIGGFFEKTFAPKALGRIYSDQLDRLNSYAVSRRSA
ncbi:MAG: SRPBCC family protein [Streptosporangiales bacterium]|jgi:uncharacterized protein YndB with AHSA1/START domain|nr:SRPBCC family protein [Streptosporangiales bacterium]